MKLKFYLRGLGVGILVTTFILTVANIFSDAPATAFENTSTVAVTKAEKKTEAAAQKTTAAETMAQTQAQRTATQATTAATQAETQAPTVADTVAETQAQNKNGAPITVVMDNISYSEQAAQLIQQAGIITDWKDFNSYLISSGYAVKIHNGTYTLYAGQDYETIAKIITGR